MNFIDDDGDTKNNKLDSTVFDQENQMNILPTS